MDSLFKRMVSCTDTNRLILPKVSKGVRGKNPHDIGVGKSGVWLLLFLVLNVIHVFTGIIALRNYPVDNG